MEIEFYPVRKMLEETGWDLIRHFGMNETIQLTQHIARFFKFPKTVTWFIEDAKGDMVYCCPHKENQKFYCDEWIYRNKRTDCVIKQNRHHLTNSMDWNYLMYCRQELRKKGISVEFSDNRIELFQNILDGIKEYQDKVNKQYEIK